MLASALYLIPSLVSLVGLGISKPLPTLPIYYRSALDAFRDKSTEIVVGISDMNKMVFPIMNTGSTFTFFIWNVWYRDLGDCFKLLYRCYRCPNPNKPCHEGPLSDYVSSTGRQAVMFPHREYLGIIGPRAFEKLTFGLVVGPDTNPWSSFGISLKKSTLQAYPSLIEQLMSPNLDEGPIIDRKAYSFYLPRKFRSEGELILGGENKTHYCGSMKYVNVEDAHLDAPGMAFNGLNIGDFDPIVVSGVVYLDTSVDSLQIHESLKSRVINLLQTAGTKNVTIEESSGLFYMDCSKIVYLPYVTFLLKGHDGRSVRFEMTPYNLEGKRVDDRRCTLALTFGPVWYLGAPSVVGTYIYVTETQIGFASLVQSLLGSTSFSFC